MRSVTVLLLLTSALPVLAAPKTAVGTRPPSPSDNVITVTRAPGILEGAAWDVTLPKGVPGDLLDQAWLVVDGHRKGFGGGYFPYWSQRRTARLYANVSDELDKGIKEVLKAQGLPVKQNVNVYRLSYGVNSPKGVTGFRTLRFLHSAPDAIYTQFPLTARYKVGERIPLFEVVAVDSDIGMRSVFDPKDPIHHTLLPLPSGMAHQITVEVQFVPARHGVPLVATTP